MDVEQAFQHTFNSLFGKGDEEIRLDDFKDYLFQYAIKGSKRKSSISGKDVTLVSSDYCEDAKFISQDEVDINRKFEPLSINEVKDIDSILEALGDRAYYTGNKVLGKSDFVEDVDFCVDSFYVRGSLNIQQSKYVGYSWMVRSNSEYAFGSAWMGEAKHIIRTIAAYNITRCFESYYLVDTSDCYFSYNCVGCSNVLFSFNQRGTRYAIGNLRLPKDKYLGIKSKVMGEVREKLVRDKSFPSLFQFFPRVGGKPPEIRVEERKDEQDMGKVEKAFAATSRIVFGKDVGPLSKLEGWLGKHRSRIEEKRTPFGRHTHTSSLYSFMRDIDDARFVTGEEAMELGKLSIKLDEEGIGLRELVEKASKIAYYSPEIITGRCQNVIETPIAVSSVNVYRIDDSTNGKNSGVSTLVLNSEYIFGSYRAVNSKFCINCYHSLDLSNCFEMDSCSHSRNSMFCHNCENLDNCMFCFNTKTKRYAIGNVEVGRERYMRIKEMIVKLVLESLERTGDFRWDIYNIGCPSSKD
ncbi:MAG: hypothetical protein ABIG39_04695 [Candidatus Micrarchaeota archaeon]